MKGLVFVYAVCFAIGIILIIGGVMLGRGGMASVDKVTKYLYGGVQFGMILGVGWTGLYASSYRVPAIGGRGRDPLSPQRKRGVVKPHLVPDYSIIPRERLGKVAAAVFRGEQRYRDLLTVGTGSRDASFHLSQVHSYRDVETQAFIMAHHADDGSSSELREVELRAMWVYLTHWFDDVFDSFRPDELAVLDLQGKFDVGETLGELDERYRRLWECAVNATQATPGVTWNRELLEVGMRRLIHGGPMLSRRCTLRTADCSELHRQYVLDTLEADDPHGIQDLVDRVPGRHLAYTTKVVVEIWDSFQPQASFPSSLLMDFFYAPGLLYHDCEEELSMGEMDSDPEDDPNSYVATLEKTCEVLKALPVPELARMMQPVPMYLSAFQGVIRSSGGIRLLRIYDEFLKDPHVNRALGAPSVPGQGI